MGGEGCESMTTSDEWGKDPTVQMMRKVFRRMESAQEELLKAAGISKWDPRLRRWREISLAAFERAWAKAARRGIELREEQAGALFGQCLRGTMMREGIEAKDACEKDETIQSLLKEVFS